MRVGFIVDGLVPSVANCFLRRTIRPLVTGWPSGSSGFMTRFKLVSDWVNRRKGGLQYELYRPWRRYRAVIFLKSMNDETRILAQHLFRKGCQRVFDLNIDYLTPARGTFYYEGMAPTPKQRNEVLHMIKTSDAVIADSRWLKQVAKRHFSRVRWIPDSVPDEFLQNASNWHPRPSKPLPLLWCGEAVKLFELLKIEPVLRSLKKWVKLRIVTNSLAAMERIYEPWQGRLRRLLEDIDCELFPFINLTRLRDIYDCGGIFISPRFLNNSYNMGHTEWKITLPMARDRVTLCSEQPSYEDVAERSGGVGIRICRNEEAWLGELEEMLSGKFDWAAEQEAAGAVVRKHYAASVVAKAHTAFMREVLSAA